MRTRRRFQVRVTRSFERDLERIDAFFESYGVHGRLDGLIDDLRMRVVPLLERTPRAGPLFGWAPGVHVALLRRVMQRLKGDEVRTVLCGELSVLYLVGEAQVHMVSIRHHREALFRLGLPK